MVDKTLLVQGHDEIFASGDSVTVEELPRFPKSGSGAGRSGIILAENIPKAANGEGKEKMKNLEYFKSGPSINLFNGFGLDLINPKAKPSKKDRNIKDSLDRKYIQKYHPEFQ